MNWKILAAVAVLAAGAASQSQAATFSLSLSGDPTNFSESNFIFNNESYDRFYLTLDGLNAGNAITVSQGDEIDSTVTLSSLYTIGTAPGHTNILEIRSGSSFPSENTAGNGTFTFFNGADVVATFNYSSSTSGQLAAYAANFPPNNPAFTFDSFTNNFTITDLATSATLDGSAFFYDLTTPVPEPTTWAMMMVGVGAAGLMLRAGQRRPARATA